MQSSDHDTNPDLRLLNLLEWFRERRINYDESVIEIRAETSQYSGDGWGIFAKRDVPEGSTLVTIPKTAVLSVRNTDAADFLQEHRIGGGLALVFATMYEAARGKSSPWYRYLQSLPQREYLPLFWTEQQLANLRGTELDAEIRPDRDDTLDDFKNDIAPLLDMPGLDLSMEQMTIQNFQRAASWIGSRAFGVDNHHGMSLVPFADLFNHKAAVVSLSTDFTLEKACLAEDFSGDSSVESEASNQEGDGTAASASSDEEEAAVGLESGDEVEGLEVVLSRPSISAAETRGSMLDAALFPGVDLRLNIGICGATQDGEDVLEIVAACPLLAGQEIFNTFGELGNKELVSKYGFALRINPFSTVELKKEQMVNQAEALIGEQTCRERCQYLTEQSNLLEEDEEPFEVLPKGQIGPSLLVAARLLTCSATEFGNIKDLDLTEAVTRLLPPSEQAFDHFLDINENAPSKRRKLEDLNASSLASSWHLKGQQDSGNTDRPTLVESGEVQGSAAEINLGNTLLAKCDEVWLPRMLQQLLRSCLQYRLKCYQNDHIAADSQELKRALKEMPRGEARTAVVAAHTLVITEKEILIDALAALNEAEKHHARES